MVNSPPVSNSNASSNAGTPSKKGWDNSQDRRRYSKEVLDGKKISVMAGQCYVTDKKDEILSTVLGSCIAACIRDTRLGLGGMNHFLLPESNSITNTTISDSMRYGAFAMEQLINEILKCGGSKKYFEIKIFGGANVIKSSALIGTRNIHYVYQFLLKEGLSVTGQDVGGDLPRRVHYFPVTGKVKLLKLQRVSDQSVIEEEKRYAASLTTQHGNDAELF